MAKKKALITGITGQDGSYLAEYLLSLGYEVHGMVRRLAYVDPKDQYKRIEHIQDQVHLHSGTLESYPCLYKIFQDVMPDELYHLAAQSFVSYSFEDEFSTMNTNVNGTHYILSALYSLKPECKFYFAGSSEMFGKVEAVPQTETTRFHPRSIYGVTKATGFDLTRHYREAYGVFACTGILFNHESPRRGMEFVTRKISSHVAKIKLGLADELRLGNLEAKRDWGFSGDYVKAMHAMLNYSEPIDFVVGTGECHSIRDFLELAFGYVDLDYEKYVVVDPKFYRPSEVDLLIADPSMVKEKLGWKSETEFKDLVEMMVQHDLDLLEGFSGSKKKAA